MNSGVRLELRRRNSWVRRNLPPRDNAVSRGSNIGSLAYTVAYATGNILLTVEGPVVVAMVHAMRTP